MECLPKFVLPLNKFLLSLPCVLITIFLITSVCANHHIEYGRSDSLD